MLRLVEGFKVAESQANSELIASAILPFIVIASDGCQTSVEVWMSNTPPVSDCEPPMTPLAESHAYGRHTNTLSRFSIDDERANNAQRLI
jgi:hypothetical protein